ncbi:MAG: insulinase family protein [Planctomycetia bacterium]|nr:insulinase family protein [Planctomycetia bacterium]
MPQEIHQHTLPNGLTLLAEHMEHVRSATLNFLVPAGCVNDPPDKLGVASVLSELIVRGAGERDNRALTLALDSLGVDRGESVLAIHTQFSAGTLARNLPQALEIYADILRRPHFPDEEMEPVQALALQDLQGLEDEPRHKVMIELARHHYPPPFGQDRRGTVECIKKLTIDDVRKHYRRLFRPRGTLLTVAGNLDWPKLRDQVERLFGDWQGGEEPTLKLGAPPPKRKHLAKETAQTQIALAYDSVPIQHPDFYAARAAVDVLSGGMSSRLFTEVREKEALCYAVSASYRTFKERGSVFCYAGTTNERAQRTLDVIVRELKKLQDGIETDEVQRVQAAIKSALIMQQESTAARAAAMALDWYYLGRIRSLEEIQTAINNLTPATIVEHVRRCPPRDFTVVTLGPKALDAPA